MTSVLLKFYPYEPVINAQGTIDPSSIHTKKSEAVLTIFTTALPASFLYQKIPHTWFVLAAAVFGAISYLFWSHVGQTIPKKLADQMCVNAFFTKQEIPEGLAKRVLGDKALRDQIYAQISSVKNTIEKQLLLEFYFSGIVEHAIPETQKTLFNQAVQSSCVKFLTKVHLNLEFLDFLVDTDKLAIWKLARNSPTVEALKRFFSLEKNYNGKTVFESYVADVIQNQSDQELYLSAITSMEILINNESPTKLQSTYSISKESSLAAALNQSLNPNSAEKLLKKFIAQ